MNAERPGLAYVVSSLNPGGTEKLVAEMSRAFATEFTLHVLCLDEPGIWADELREQGIAVHCLWRQPGLDLSVPVKLASFCRRHEIRVIHAHQCTPWFYAALSRLLYGAPKLLLEEHGRFYPEVKNRRRILFNKLLIRPLTHRFVAVSADIATRLVTYEGLRLRQIQVIYNGVTPEPSLSAAARQAMRRELGFSDDDFVVGTVGRFDPIKNLPMLVHSLAAAGEQMGNLRGLLVGYGPLFGEIGSLVAVCGLGERVRMTGFRNDARQVIQCMDLFVLCSLSEGTSMALLEAMAAGVPVAVTRVGGNPEIVLQDRTGWVVPSQDESALTQVIREAARQADRRRAFASAAKQRFAESFAFERMIQCYRSLYSELLSTRS